MGRQIQIIATADEILDIVEVAKQRFPELYVWEKILVGVSASLHECTVKKLIYRRI